MDGNPGWRMGCLSTWDLSQWLRTWSFGMEDMMEMNGLGRWISCPGIIPEVFVKTNIRTYGWCI